MSWWIPLATTAAQALLGSGQGGSAGTVSNPYSKIKIPDIEKQKLLLEEYASAGNLSPEALQALSLSQQDQLENVQLDPRLKQAQVDALDFMQKTGQGDLTPAERAQVNNLRRQVEADNTSRMQALLQQQDARGVGSSDMALAQRMIEAQGSANRQAQSTDNVSAAAFNRALQSMAQGASLASNMEQADYSRQAQLADAQRQREMTDWTNRQNIGNQNVQSRNAAQQFNLQNQQNLLSQNVGLRNQQQEYNKKLLQQEYENRMRKADSVAGINRTNAAASQANQARRDEGLGNMIGAVGRAGAAYLGAQKTKEDDIDLGNWFKSAQTKTTTG